MPTQSTTYNTRLTDEALEKRFRDTFRSQGGAELVDDLYASGVIIPVVDFTQAAEGSQLPANLQNAWDFSTGTATATNSSATAISNSGFWRVGMAITFFDGGANANNVRVEISNGLSSKVVNIQRTDGSGQTPNGILQNEFVVFLRPGDSLNITSTSLEQAIDVWYRQIADVSGNLINPTGFSSS